MNNGSKLTKISDQVVMWLITILTHRKDSLQVDRSKYNLTTVNKNKTKVKNDSEEGKLNK